MKEWMRGTPLTRRDSPSMRPTDPLKTSGICLNIEVSTKNCSETELL